MSIATVVFLAGDRRVAGCPLLIHNPWISVKGDSRLLKDAADYMAASEKRLEKFYAEKTGLPAETLSDLMQSDRTITKEESVTLGFATEIFDSKPVAFAHHNINNMTEKEKKELQDKLDTQSKLFDKILAKVGLKRIAKDDETEILALELTTATGETLTVERESGDPQVGDAATPDGEFVLPDGSTIVVADGVITEIRPKEDAPATEDVAQQLAKATARISVLEQQLRTAQAAKLSKEQKEIIDSVQALGGKDVLAKIQSTYKAQARKKDFETPSNPIAERVAKIKEARTKSV
jgi:ATP-dependent Clp protease protease subunit